MSVPLAQGVPGASILFEANRMFYGATDDALDVEPPRFQGDYFFYHHTTADTVTILDSDQMDRSAAVFAVTAYAVAMLDAKLPRVGAGNAVALQTPEERAMVNAQLTAGGEQCPAGEGAIADMLTPAQCAVVLQQFPTACPQPAGGWTTAAAAQYTCSDDCAKIFVTAYNQCRVS